MEKTNTKKKVLVVNTIGMGFEGMSFVILNYLRNMPREDLQLHITADRELCDEMREILEALGTVHIIPMKQEDPKGYLMGIRQILKTGFDVIHVHGNSGTMAMEAVLARMCGVKKVFVHSHSTKTDHPLVNAILKYPMMLCASRRLACSAGSGKWLYGNWKHTVLNNAIDLARFRFDPDVRDQCRKEFGLGEAFVLGHIGNFYEPKNHSFLIDVFAEFHKLQPDSRLLLAGGGPDVDLAVEKVNQLQLQDAVIFAGRRTDVERIYQALDVFVMPSLWEGLPLVLLEAQASGLPVLASDRITKDVQCSRNFRYLPLEEGPAVWVEQLLQLREAPVDRTGDAARGLRERGFDIRTEAERLHRMYVS